MANNQDISDSLIRACCDGNQEIVRNLINTYGLSYSDAWSEGYNLLCNALRHKHRIVANILLNNGCKVNNTNRSYPEPTPLHLAVENDYIEIVNMLLYKGADIDAKDEDGDTALRLAISFNHYEVVELLLKHKADINIRNKYGWTPLCYALLNEHFEVFEFLITYKSDNQDMHVWTPNQNATSSQIIEFFLMNKADNNGFDFNKRSPYVQATFKRCLVKLKTANLHVNDVNLPILPKADDEISDFQKNCELEINKMKNWKINDTNITFYDILTKFNKTTSWIRNGRVVDGLKTQNYVREFPIYSNILTNQLNRGMKRNKLLEQSWEVYRSIFNNLRPKLPDECIENVLEYLSNEDLEILLPY